MHPKDWRGPTWLVVLWSVVGLPFVYMLWQGPGPDAEPYMRSAMSWVAAYATGGWLVGAVALFMIWLVTLPIGGRRERAASRPDRSLFRRDPGPIWPKTEEDPKIDWRIAGFLVAALSGVIVVAGVIDSIRP